MRRNPVMTASSTGRCVGLRSPFVVVSRLARSRPSTTAGVVPEASTTGESRACVGNAVSPTATVPTRVRAARRRWSRPSARRCVRRSRSVFLQPVRPRSERRKPSPPANGSIRPRRRLGEPTRRPRGLAQCVPQGFVADALYVGVRIEASRSSWEDARTPRQTATRGPSVTYGSGVAHCGR